MAKPVKHYGKFRIRVIDASGKRQSAVFDTYREADKWGKLMEADVVRVRQGLPPMMPAAPSTTRPVVEAPPASASQEKTFSDLVTFWLDYRAPGKRSRKDDASIIRRHLLPAFGPRRLSEISTGLVMEHSAKAVGSTKTLWNRLTLLRTMLALAVDLEWLGRLPKIQKPKIRSCDAGYRWLRTRREIDLVLGAARAEGEQVFVLYATATWTGMRKGELAALRWADVDFEKRLVSVERSFKGPTKSGRTRHLPIVDPLLPVLRAWRLKCPGDLVFPNERGTLHNSSARIFEETLHRVLKRAGLAHERKRGELKPHITFHDLRHTFASHWVLGGGDIFRLQKILGHASIDMTQRYAHLAPDAYTDDRGRFGQAFVPGGQVVVLPAPVGDVAV